MALDRLKDLKKGVAAPDDVALNMSDIYNQNDRGEKSGLVDNQNQQFMQEFLGDVELVKANIHIIREATKKIADINQRVVLATNTEKEQNESNDLGPILKSTNAKAALTKKLLQALRDSTDQIRKSPSAKLSEIRIRDNLLNTLTRKFVDVMKEYQSVQTKYKTDIKKKVKRQVQIVKPDATTEEVDAVLKSGGGAGELFKTAILKGEAADTIRNAYMNVAEKYQDVIALEASVAELHQMFLDFALLTEQQGELLDQIEHQVKAASDYIDSGNVQLEQAIELQKSIRAKQCCIIVTVLIIIAIIVGAILAGVGSQGGL